MVLRRQFGIALRWFPLLILGTLLAAATTYVLTSRQQQFYQASATLLPEQLLPSSNTDPGTVSISRLVSVSTSYGVIATSRELVGSVGKQLGLTEPVTELVKRVTATTDGTTAALTVSARGTDPAGAAAFANAIANAVASRSSASDNDPTILGSMRTISQQLVTTEAEYQRLLALPEPRSADDTTRLANTVALLDKLTASYDALTASLSKGNYGLTVIDPAVALAATPSSPLSQYYTLLAAVAGMIIAAAIAFGIEFIDDRVKGPDGVKEAIGAPTLGSIPGRLTLAWSSGRQRLETIEEPRSAQAEAYRAIRATIDLAGLDERVRTIVVTSALSAGAKSAAAANLAVAFAQAGRRVALVDADMRHPAIHGFFRLPNNEGLSTLLHEAPVPLERVMHAVEPKDLHVLPAGPSPLDPAASLSSHHMQALIVRLLLDYDVVILDTPTLESAIDAAVLGSYVDGALLVIETSRGRRRPIIDANDTLARAHARLIGAILVGPSGHASPDATEDRRSARRLTGQSAPPAEPTAAVAFTRVAPTTIPAGPATSVDSRPVARLRPPEPAAVEAPLEPAPTRARSKTAGSTPRAAKPANPS